jgi:DNA-binding response OmpR family regulator
MPPSLNIALVEDHKRLREATAEFLRQKGYNVYPLESAEDLSEVPGGEPIHVFILDLNLPGEDGLQLAARLRASQPDVGILMLTARGGADHIAAGYRSGADVYLAKPVVPDILLAALESLVRRYSNHRTSTATLKLDLTGQMLIKDGDTVQLNQSEVAFLVGLMRSPNRQLDIYQIAMLMGQAEQTFNQPSLEVRITRLRKKMTGIGGEAGWIRSVRKMGYQLCVSIELIES